MARRGKEPICNTSFFFSCRGIRGTSRIGRRKKQICFDKSNSHLVQRWRERKAYPPTAPPQGRFEGNSRRYLKRKTIFLFAFLPPKGAAPPLIYVAPRQIFTHLNNRRRRLLWETQSFLHSLVFDDGGVEIYSLFFHRKRSEGPNHRLFCAKIAPPFFAAGAN